MPLPSREVREEMKKTLTDAHPKIDDLFKALDTAESLLERSLYEFGSELRGEIEHFLGEPPLLKQ
ncbi:MAG: hypothetical protein QGI45_03920 [Myxococcota bacterium]|nr:hypothetical protein [Myxococcota bacterium]